MSRDKQIEEMKQDLEKCISYDEWAGKEYGIDEVDLYDTAYNLVNAGYRKQEWISVEDRLPNIDELCLLSMENRITKYRWVVIGYFHTNYDEYVTHWMPLPEAPKMKGE